MRTLSLLLLAAACSSGQEPSTHATAQALGTPPAVEGFALYAASSAAIGDGARVLGTAGVAAPANGVFGEVLQDGVRLSAGADADLGYSSNSESYSYTAIFRHGSKVKIAFLKTAVMDQLLGGFVVENAFPAMPAFPRGRAVYPGAQALTVAASSTVSTDPTASLSDLEVQAGAVLRLAAGEYQVRSVHLADDARLVGLGPVVLRVRDRFYAGARARVLASGTAGSLRIEVLGKNGSLGLPVSAPRALELGPASVTRAILFAPHGTAWLGGQAQVTGAIVARDVFLDAAATLTYQDGLSPLPGNTPLAFADEYTVAEDQALNIPADGVLGNDVDPHTLPLSAALIQGTHNGTVSLSASGAFAYLPNPDFAGTDTFRYRASNGAASSATATVTLHVDNQNDLPVIVSIPEAVGFVGQRWRYAVDCRDPDQGDTQTHSTSGAPAGLTTQGSLHAWTPAATGSYTFLVRCSDGAGAYDEQRVQLTVLATPSAASFSLYAKSSLWLRGTVVDGNAGVRDQGAGSWLMARARVEAGGAAGQVFGTGLFADSVSLQAGSYVQDLYTNNLIDDLGAHGGLVGALPAMPAFPSTSAVSAGSGALVVPADAALTLSSTRSYASITLGERSTLSLRPGVHHVGDVSLFPRASLEALGNAELRLAGRMQIGLAAYVGPAAAAGTDPETLRIEVNGTNAVMGNPSSQPFALGADGDSSVAAVLVVPNGTAAFSTGAVVFGNVYAQDIITDRDDYFFAGARPTENHLPRIVSRPAATVLEGQTFTYALQVEDDPGDTHQAFLDQAPSGLTVTAPLTVTWPTGQSAVGTHTIIVRVRDNGGLEDTQVFQLTVVNVDHPPAFTSTPPTTASEGVALTYAPQATDPDGDPLALSMLQGPAGATFNAGTFAWTPSAAQAGQSHTVVLALTDGHSTVTQAFALAVARVNHPPVFDGTPPLTAAEDQLYAVTIHARDPDPQDTVAVTAVQLPSGATFDAATASLQYTPAQADVGPHTVAFEAHDSAGATATLQYTLTVSNTNDPPVFAPVGPLTATENQAFSASLSATDPDGDALTYAAVSLVEGAVLSGAQLTWTPSDEQSGATYTLSFSATDPSGASAFLDLTVTVQAVNDPPAIDSTPVTTAQEGRPYRYLASARDPDRGDSVHWAITGPAGSQVDAATGDLTWVPTQAQANQSHTFVLTATDQGGLAATQSFTVFVANENDPPVFLSLSPPLTAVQHQPYDFAISVADDSPSVGITIDVGTEDMVVTSAQHLTWTPSEPGDYPVVLRATDSEGLFDLLSFTITVQDVNDPPVFLSTPVLTAVANQTYRYRLRARDPDGDSLTFARLQGPPGSSLEGADLFTWTPGSASIGTQATVRLQVRDAQSSTDQTFTLEVTGQPCTPGSTAAHCSALAWAHALTRGGLPLGGVAVEEHGPQATRFLSTDLTTGLATLGGGPAGPYSWTFTAPGYSPASTQAELPEQAITWVPLPRMAPLTDLVATLAAGTTFVNDVGGQVSLAFGPGSVGAPAELRGAVLDGQALPGAAPRGYSVAAALWYEVSGTLAQGPQARFTLPAPLPANPTLVLARWDEVTTTWIAAATLNATSPTLIDATLPEDGGWAVLLADQGPAAPPAMTLNAAIAPSTATSVQASALTAEGVVEPEWQVASTNPDDVTGTAHVVATHASAPPSGLWIPARLTERYAFADGRSADVPFVDLGIALYRYPPREGAPQDSLHATFPLRPRFLLGLEDLADVHQRVDLTSALAFAATPMDAAGGILAQDGLQLTVPAGAFTEPALVSLTSLSPEIVALDGTATQLAFELGWSGDVLPAGLALELSSPVLPNREYVLARQDMNEVRVVWTPVQRYHSDATGQLVPRTPSLAGITAAGTYALFGVDAPHGLVTGTVRNPNATPLAGALVQIAGLPFGAVTGGSGTFTLLGLPGPVEARAERTDTGETGAAAGTLADAASTLSLSITLGNQAPRLLRTDPMASASNVPVIRAIEVFFSEPVAQASVSAAALTVTSAAGEVHGRQSLRPDRRSLALFPDVPLAYDTEYTASVLGSITDLENNPLAGDLSFTFHTELARTRGNGTARLTSYVPGSLLSPCSPYNPANFPPDFDPTAQPIGVPGFDPSDATITCVVGSAGVADPNAPVILVNEHTGATATVISQPNGSFKSFIRGQADELLSAVFANQNGTRLTVPLERQRFDDGRIGLYASGGTLDAPNPLGGAPLELIIEPGAITQRAVFRLTGRTVEQVEALTEGTAPSDGDVVLGARVDYEGEPLRLSADVRFPIDPSDLHLPSGTAAEDAGYLLAQVRQVRIEDEDLLVYEVLDRMRYENGALATHSWPMQGALLGALGATGDLAIIRLNVQPVAMAGYVAACPIGSCSALEGVQVATQNALNPAVIPPTGRLLPFAVVYATLANSGGPRPGAAASGQLVSLADERGRYSIAFPLSAGRPYTLRGAHPDFPNQRPSVQLVSSPPGAVGLAHLIFGTGSDSTADQPPVIHLSHAPQRPSPWVPAGNNLPGPQERALLRIVAEHPDGPPVIQRPGVEVRALVQGQTVTAGDVVLTEVSSEDTGPNEHTSVFRVTCPVAALVRLHVHAAAGGRSADVTYPIQFGGVAVASEGDVEATEIDDQTGPSVLRSSPPALGRLLPGQPMVLELSEAIQRSILQDTSVLELTPPVDQTPWVSLSPDQRTLQIVFANLEPGRAYSLALTSGVSDLSGNPLDQDPTEEGNNAFVLDFRTGAESTDDTSISAENYYGGGAVVHGGYAYVMNRQRGSIDVYEVATGSGSGQLSLRPARAPEILPNGYPRGLAVIPNFSYVRPLGSTSQYPCGAKFPWNEEPRAQGLDATTNVSAGCLSRDRTLLAVVGGVSNPRFTVSNDTVTGWGQYLRIYDITDAPEMVVVSNSPVTGDPLAAADSLQWSPPHLSYVLRSEAGDTVNAVNLQSFIFGLDLSADQYSTMPVDFTPGADLNGDGDFGDANEQLPMPARPQGGVVGLGFAGLELNASSFHATERIHGYDYFGRTRFTASILDYLPPIQGTSNPNPNPLPFAYQTLSKGSEVPMPMDAVYASFPPWVVELEAVGFLPDQRILVRTASQAQSLTAGTRQILDLAMVAASSAIDNRLFLLNVTDPHQPALLGSPDGIPVAGGTNDVQKIEVDPVLSGLLRVSTTDGIVLLDIDRLTMEATGASRHPAIRGFVPHVGSTLPNNGDTPFGLHVLADTRRAVFTGPELYFVSLPDLPSVVQPSALQGDTDATIQETLRHATIETGPRVARIRADDVTGSGNNPPLPATLDPAHHFYVLMYAPGIAGPTIDLMVEGLNDAGYPVPNRGPGFAPVRGASARTQQDFGLEPNATESPIRPLVARRLSSQRTSAYYNVYLSDPFVLTYQKVSLIELSTLRATREVYHSTDGLRISIDPSLSPSNVLAPFASSRGPGNQVRLGTALQARTFAAERILGPNPPPIAGAYPAPGTVGMVAMHNGELRFATPDLTLPSAQLPLAFVRQYTGQDYIDGPFGPGFDFNYQQRLVELPRESFLAGEEVLLVNRGTRANSTIAQAGDVLLHTGAGTIVHYRRQSGRPGEYANDPLLQPLFNTATDWYLPEPGVFDALVRVASGDFWQITPDGMRYLYGGTGRLKRIYHRYTRNSHELFYNVRGELTQILDRTNTSTAQTRIDLGYYRAAGDPLLRAGLDEVASAPHTVGRVRRLRDNLTPPRDVLFTYLPDGRLSQVEGVEIRTFGPAGEGGRRRTTYGWTDRFLTAVAEGSIAGEPSLAVGAGQIEGDGRIQEVTGHEGRTSFAYGAANTALALASGTAGVSVTTDDTTRHDVTFTAFAMPRVVSAQKGGPGEITRLGYDAGARYLVRTSTSPKGTYVNRTYSASARNLRSRGNLIALLEEPRTAGPGSRLSASTPEYDELYNLPVGRRTDFEGRASTVSLTGDRMNIAAIEHAGGIFESFGYDGTFGQLTAHRALDGTTEAWQYDPGTRFVRQRLQGAIVERMSYLGCGVGGRLGRPCVIATAHSLPVEAQYDELGREISTTQGLHGTRVSRNRNGDRVQVEEVVGSGRRYTELRQYDSRGFLQDRTQQSVETDGVAQTLGWHYEPDAMGRVASEVTPDSTTRRIVNRDQRGRVTDVEVGTQHRGFRYDLDGLLVQRTVGASSTPVETLTYDGHGRLETSTDPYSAVTRIGRTGNGHLSSLSVSDRNGTLYQYSASALDPVGRPQTWQEGGASHGASYDDASRTIQVTGPMGARLTQRHDSAGLLSSTEVGGLFTTAYQRDGEGRPSSVTQMEGTTPTNFGQSYSYNPMGDLSALEDARGTQRLALEHRFDGVPTAVTVAPGDLALRTTMHASILGEPMGHTSPLGVGNLLELDRLRRPSREGPNGSAGPGRRHEFDTSELPSAMVHADGSRESYSNFDEKGNPRTITIPGGSIQAQYDLKDRVTSREVRFGQTATTTTLVRDTFGYDGLDRMRTATFDGGSLSHRYDLLGVRDRTVMSFGGDVYQIGMQSYPMGAPRDQTYPSGATVHALREPTGRLSGLELESQPPRAGGPLVSVTSYAMATAPAVMQMGSGLQREDSYDYRRRLTMRRYTQNGRVLSDERYAYDSADRVTIRQHLENGGRADLFTYDADSRLTRAEIGARPIGQAPATGPWQTEPRWGPGDYARTYTYDTEGRDRVISTGTDTWPAEPAPAVAQQLQEPDGYGHAGRVDGLLQTTDPLGNTTRVQLETGAADLLYDGLSRLVRVTRADGSTIRYDYRPDGPLYRRTVQCTTGAAGCVNSRRVYAYDGLRLLEEYETGAGPRTLMARYFYADEGDIPFAGDFNDGTAMVRYYFITDRMGTVTGLVDEAGNVVERYQYDPWGRPTVEPEDATPPAICEIIVESDQDIIVAMCEPVLPPVAPPPAPSPQVNQTTTSTPTSLDDSFEVEDNGVPVQAQALIDPTFPGHPRGSVIRLALSQALLLAGTLNVSLADGRLLDRAGNVAPATTLSVSSGLGTVYLGGAPGSTGTVRIERSAVGNSIGFQAHLYDQDADLILARARVLDPNTGSFLQRDPFGYEDSVNLYAGFKWDPVNRRDPTGQWVHIVVGGGIGLLYNVAHQLAEMHDGTRTEFSIGEAAFSGGAGAIAAATFGVSAGAATFGTAVALGLGVTGVQSASREAAEGNHATAMVEYAGAALSLVGGINGLKSVPPGPMLATAEGVAVDGAIAGNLKLAATEGLKTFGLGEVFAKGKDRTEPTLPPHEIAEGGGVTIEHYYRGNDHPPAHAHVVGGGPETRIGPNGKPLPGDPELTTQQKALVKEFKSVIRRAIGKIGRWLDYHETK